MTNVLQDKSKYDKCTAELMTNVRHNKNMYDKCIVEKEQV